MSSIINISKIREEIYSKSPIWLQNYICGIYGSQQKKQRYGGEFYHDLEWLEGTQWWEESDIENYQNEQLRKIIKHAYSTVPFYRKRFDAINLKPDDIKTVNDLYKIPILTKDEVRANIPDLISSEYNVKQLIPRTTSGSTGKRLQFYTDLKALQFLWAIWWRLRRRFGLNVDDRHAVFSGRLATPPTQSKPPFWRENRPMNQTYFNVQHLVPGKISAIVDKLNSESYTYYGGYPSALSLLASLIADSNMAITHKLKCIKTGSETLMPVQKEILNKVFGCPVIDEYGFGEGCGNASKCEKDVYHEDPELGIMECVDPRDSSPNEKWGRIVCTGLSCYSMPFIRYDVGDIGTWREEKCECGRHSKILPHIDGRIDDYVLTPEGRKIARFSHVFKVTSNISEAQVIQYELGEIHLKILRGPNFSVKDEQLILAVIQKQISPSIKVHFEFVKEIEREPNGKLRAVKNLIDKESRK